MCGFAGSFFLNKTYNTNLFTDWSRKCSKLLSHRGPDAEGVFLNEFLNLTARRLRIHDLNEKADQPFRDPKDNYVLVFNGSIFNYKEIRNSLIQIGKTFETDSDTEVVMYAIAEWGKEALVKFDGMYSLAFFNKKKKQLIIARDKLGIKPLYYFLDTNVLLFSSEIKPILSHPLIKKEFNKDVVEEFFAFQALLPPNTFFKNIKVLEPGKCIVIDTQSTRKPIFDTYWDLINVISQEKEKVSIEEELIYSLKNCWQADRNIGIQLSGGVDSSLVSAFTKHKLKIDSAETFSIIFDDSKIKYYEPRSEEKYVDIVNDKFRFNGHKYLFTNEQIKNSLAEAIWYNEMPINGPSTCLYLLFAKEIKKHTTVLLTGEGADDIFLGYFNDWNFDSEQSLLKEFIKSKNIISLFGKEGLQKSFSSRKDLIDKVSLNKFNKQDQASYLTIKAYLHGLLARHDRMFMASGVEGRLPFCTDEIIKARFKLSETVIHNNSHGKIILKNLAEKYFSKEFIYRKKIGFSSPFGDWCSNENYWRNFYEKLPLDFFEDFTKSNFLKNHRKMDENIKKWSGQNLNIIFSFINLFIWHQIYFESNDFSSQESWRKVNDRNL